MTGLLGLVGRVVSGVAGAVLGPVLRPVVGPIVQAAIAEHTSSEPHVPPNDLLEHPMVYGDRAKLHIDETAIVNNALFNLSSGEITIGRYAFFGHNVSVLTGTHDITTFDAERQVAVPKQGRDIVIGRGVWISSNAVVLGPCRIGDHAVVAAGALVTGDVETLTVVAGSPAKPVRTLDPPPGP